MTTLYLAIDSFSDYEGGGDQVLGVYSTEEKAIECLQLRWVNTYSKSLETFINIGGHSYAVDECYTLSVETVVLDEIIADV